MLSPIEKLYLKTYSDRFDNAEGAELAKLIEEHEFLFRNSPVNSQAQRQNVLIFLDLLYYAALREINNSGHRQDCIFMVSATVIPQDGMIGSLNERSQATLANSRIEHWYVENSSYQYAAFVDTPPDSTAAQRLRNNFNTLYTSPRMVLRDFVMSRVK